MKIYSGSVAYDQLSPFGVVVQRWTAADVRNWLFGLGDFIVEYLPNFKQIDGDSLLKLFDDDLKDLGVESLSVRRKICSILKQLTHLCYDAEDENLQILIAAVGRLARNLYNELKRHLLENSTKRALPLNFISICDNLDRKVKKLLSWFDRPPFLGQERFFNLRKSISTITLDILDWNLNDNTLNKEQCRQLITSLQISCAQLYTLCDKILQESCDVLLLQNSYFERCDLNRKSPDIDLGIFFDTVEHCHIVKSLKFQSPADLASKIQIGDEILDVNGQIVVGWTHENVQNRFFHLKSLKITFLLKKQPRDSWNIFKLSTPRQRKIVAAVATSPDIQKIAGSGGEKSSTSNSSDGGGGNVGDSTNVDVDDSKSSTTHRPTLPSSTMKKRRRRSSSFSHNFKTKIDENSIKNEEIPKTTRKWKSVKAPTTATSSRKLLTTTLRPPRSRRVTVSGGSPTLKRLSLHVHDRKCSLMPQERREKADVTILESPQIKQKLTQLFSAAAVDQSFSSSSTSTTDGAVDSSKSAPLNISHSPPPMFECCSSNDDDDVFANGGVKMNDVERRQATPFEKNPSTSLEDDENSNRRRSNFFDSQKTLANFPDVNENVTAAEFATVTAGPSMPADDVLWNEKSKIVEKPEKDLNKDFDLKGVVDFDGPIILPNLVNEISKKKIEKFFGENFDESIEKIEERSSLKNRSRRSSSPATKISSPKSPSSEKSLKIFHQKDSNFKNLQDSILSSTTTGSQLSLLLSKNRHGFLWRYFKNSNLSLNNSIDSNPEIVAYASLNNEKLSACFFDQSKIVGSMSRDYSGWLYRYKLPDEFGHAPKHLSRWLIRWAVLRDNILQLYIKKEDSRPEGLICLSGCKVRPCPSASIKSSKKNIFQIVYQDAPFYFYCTERKNMIEWLNRLGLSAIGYTSGAKKDAILKGFYFERFTLNDMQ